MSRITLNHQTKEKSEASYGSALYVNSIFQTIQGEGPLSGERAIFLRLAGCNLQCPLCDTEYTKRNEWSIETVVDKIIENQFPENRHNQLVVITGGEPFRQ